MRRTRPKPLEAGTPVTVNIAQGAAVAQGVIADSHWDDGWMYRIEVTGGDECRDHRDEEGEFWVCDFEVTTREA